MAMGYLEYCLFFVFAALVVFLSFVLDYMWARILPNKVIHRIFVTPGIIIHELSHAAGCLITGAKIEEIKFFTETGGHVKHGKAKIPILGQGIISMAPLFGIPLFLLGLSLLFKYVPFFGCWFPTINANTPILDLLLIPLLLFKHNFITSQNWWFILYLYLALSLVVCMAPSGPDFKNSIIALAILFGLGLLIIFIGTKISWWDTPVLGFIIQVLYYPIGIGFVLELITLVITIPLFVISFMIRRRA